MAKLVSHVIRTLGEGFQEEELQLDSEFPSAGKMQLDRGRARVDRRSRINEQRCYGGNSSGLSLLLKN